MDFVGAGHGVRNAVEVVDGVFALEVHLNNAGPMAAFEEAGHGVLDQLVAFARGFLDEVAERLADDLLKRRGNEIGKAPVHGANFAFEAERQKNVVKGIDQVAVALLGAGNDLEELVELLVAGGSGVTLLDAANEAAEVGGFAVALPGVGDEEHDKNNKAEHERLEAMRKGANGIPGNNGETDGNDEQKNKGETPELVLTALKLLETRGHALTRFRCPMRPCGVTAADFFKV